MFTSRLCKRGGEARLSHNYLAEGLEPLDKTVSNTIVRRRRTGRVILCPNQRSAFWRTNGSFFLCNSTELPLVVLRLWQSGVLPAANGNTHIWGVVSGMVNKIVYIPSVRELELCVGSIMSTPWVIICSPLAILLSSNFNIQLTKESGLERLLDSSLF
jgi:nucleotidyltransferase/DNA polymerase involved in DNA repair